MRKTLVLDDPLSACTSRFVDASNTREKEERCSNAWAPVYCDRGPRREIARLGECRVFVELACGYHALFYEISRQLSAFEIERKAQKSISYGRERDSLHGGNSRQCQASGKVQSGGPCCRAVVALGTGEVYKCLTAIM
jgi:hypothetical protein